jgi:hypothetical protein
MVNSATGPQMSQRVSAAQADLLGDLALSTFRMGPLRSSRRLSAWTKALSPVGPTTRS